MKPKESIMLAFVLAVIFAFSIAFGILISLITPSPIHGEREMDILVPRERIVCNCCYMCKNAKWCDCGCNSCKCCEKRISSDKNEEKPCE